jgi:hypothetical protein
MTTNFIIASGITVPSNYFWDLGNPLETTPTTVIADSTTEYISGYAPGVKVIFKPEITDLIYSDFPNVSSTYIWNFGDFYNSTNNTVVFTCKDTVVEHTYILPGKYSVSLTNIQSKENQPLEPETFFEPCYGKHGIGWQWDGLQCSQFNQTTWDETMCIPPATANKIRSKWWDEEGKCFEQYCKVWNWRDLKLNGKNPIFWYQVFRYGEFAKRWQYEVNETVCEIDDVVKATVETTEQIALKTFIVEVKEILPVASITNTTYPLTGYSPFTFKLSPIHTKTGSFPIDRIDWEPGDGSSIKTVTRYSKPDEKYFTYNNAFFSDPLDPRNYDFVYTISRNNDSYPVFYPSLTCYSASTNSYDSCSIVVGPILLQPQPQNIFLIKNKRTTKGDFYGVEINKNITLLTTLTSPTKQTSIPLNIPSSPVRQKTDFEPVTFFGNTGTDYPPLFVPSCEYTPSEYSLFYFVTEENSLSAISLEDESFMYK